MKIFTQSAFNFKANVFGKITSLLGLFAVLLFSSASFGQAASATWAGTTDATAAIVGNVSGSSQTFGAGLTGTGFSATNGFQGQTWPTSAYSTSQTNFYQFAVSPTTGNNFSISSVALQPSISGPGTATWAVYYSTSASFTSPVQIGSNTTVNSTTPTTTTFSSLSIPVTAGNTIYLRFIAGSADAGTRNIRVRNFVVSGTTSASAATYTSIVSGGDWNTAATWSVSTGGNGVPTAGSTVVVNTNVTAAATPASQPSSITVNNGFTLTLNGTYTNPSGSTVTVAAGGTLAVGAAYTNTGTTTVNGTFQINQSGFGGGAGTWTYGAASSLVFNHTSGTYGAIDATHTYWPSTSGPVNVTVANSAATGINMSVSRTVTGIFQTAGNIQGTALTLNGTIRINTGGAFTSSPTYGSASTLIYNTGAAFTRGNEWVNTSGAGYPANVQISNPGTVTTLNMGTSLAQCSGSITIDASTVLNTTSGGLTVLGSVTNNGTISLGADVKVAGNWTVGSAATQTNNSKAVFFNAATGDQTVAKTGGGSVIFDYLVIDKATSGNVVIASTPATDVTINTASGNVLQLNNTGGLDLNGRTLALNNSGGGIFVNGSRTITSGVAGGKLDINNYKFVANNAGVGALILAANVTVNLNTNGNFDFGKSGATYITTLNGTLSINSTTSCFVNTNPPIYGAASLVKYNSGGIYGRGLEWSTTSGAGYPNDVQVTNTTTLNYPNTGNSGTDPFSTALAVVRDLTIDSGSALYMDYGANGNKSGALTVGRNVSLAGSLSLGNLTGGDLNIAGNWTRTGTFTPNGRAVQFNGASAQTLTGATTFDYLTLGGNGGVTLQASSAVTVNNTIVLGNGGTSGKLTLGANTLTIGATGAISGASSSSFIVTNTATSLLKRNSVGNTATLFPVGNLSTSYTPLTITNTGTTNDLSVASSATIDNAVSDATKIVTLQWTVASAGTGAVGTVVFNWNAANQGASYVATGTGELGVYTTGPYAITSLGAMAGQTKTVAGVALASGTNKLVLGNTGGVYTPPPANDDCSGAIALTVGAAATAGNNTFATKSSPTGLTVSGYTTGTAKDMWYTFTPSCSGSHVITLIPTGFDGAIALFTGGSCPNPTYTTSADLGTSGATETITFTATAGVTYRVLAWGFNSSVGSFTVGVTSSVTPNFALANTGTPAIGNVPSNTNNAVLYGFALTPTACTNSFDFTAASITTAGTATTSDLSNFRLIVDANANGLADTGEIAAPIGTVSTLANPLAFTVTGQTGLTAVTRYLLIANVAAGATGGNTFTGSMAAANVTATAPVTVSGTAAGNTQTITSAAIVIADNTQVTAASFFRGSTNNIISKAQLTVSGLSTTVSAMNFITAGATAGYVQADIAAGGFKLWVSTTNTFGSATQVGSGVSSAKTTATSTETLNFATSQSLTIGTTYYYWLTVDVAVTATVNKTITVNGLTSASVVSAGTSISGTTTASGVQTIIAPTLAIANNTIVPAGNVLANSTGNIIARAQFTISNANVDLSAMSYVTAANTGGYTSADIATGGFKLWVSTTNTFGTATQVGASQSSTKVTANSTETITFTATQNLTAGTVYYYWLTADIASAATAGKLIIANGLAAASLTSTTTGVSITGTSSASGTQTIVVPTLTIANNTQVTTQNLFVGSTNNIVSRAQVTPTFDNVAASAISFVTAGNATGYTSADIASGGFKLWVNTTNTFGTATQVGSGQSSTKTTATNTETITFTATQNFTLATTYYYWLTADITSGATVGNIVIVNGLSSASITTTTANAVVTGTTSATGNQTIVVPTVTLANTGTPAAGSIAVGANNVVLFGFGLTPNSAVDFTAASITTSGTATTSDLSNFRLVYDANANGVADSSEITGAIGTVSTLSGTLVFTGLTGQTAFSTLRRYLLIADAASGATSGRTFTGNLVAANITTTATTNTGSAAGNAQTLVYVVAAGEIVINQLNPGYNAATNEYIELVNKTGKAFDLSTLTIIYYSSGGTAVPATIGPLSGTLQPYSFWLLGTASTVTVGTTTSLATDGTFTGGMAANNGQISLQRISDNLQIDGVAYGGITSNAVSEGSAAPAGTTAPSVSIKRTVDGVDTNSNSADFSTVPNASIYLRNSTGRLANAGATIVAGTYRDLSVTGGSSISGNVSVTSQVRLDNNGILATGVNVLTLTSTGAVSRTSGWINGNFKKNIATGATNKTFEIGGNTFYRPVSLVFASVTTAGDLTAAVTATAGDYSGISASGIDAAKSVNRYWTLTNSGIVYTNYGATFTFDAGDVDAGATTANFIVRNYDSSWATSTAGTRTATTTQATGITSFGYFVIGETTGTPTVATSPSNVTTCPSISTSFSGTSSSVPTPTIYWERGISGTYATVTSILDGGVYSNFNTSTLAVSNTSGLTGYTYRAVFTNINGTVTSAAATLTTGTTKTYSAGWSPSAPTSIDAAVISSGYSQVADINACSLTVTSGAVVIPSGNNVTLSGPLTVSSGSFTLENTSNLIQTGTGYSNSGNIIVKRDSSALKRLDYTLWSSPVTGQGLYTFSPTTLPNRFYVYNTGTNAYSNSVGFSLTNLQYPSPLVSPNGINGTDTANVSFATGIGYLIRVPYDHPTTATVWHGSFTGVPNNGDIPVSVSLAGGAPIGTGYNAVGNPYPSRLSVPNFIDGNTNISGTLYFWRKTNNASADSYATLTKTAYVANGYPGGDTGTGFFPTGGGQEANWVLNVGQGFFVKANSGSTITFTNAMRRSSNTNQFFKTSSTAVSSVTDGLYWLNLNADTGIFSQMAVGYSAEGTLAADRGIDGENINHEFYLTSLIGTGEYSVQGRPDFQLGDVVPLSYKVTAAGTYTISIDHTDGLFAGGTQPIYLKDTLTNTEHDLQSGAYSFTTEVGTFANRFEIAYQSQLGIENPTFTANAVIVYGQNTDLVINSGASTMSSIKVFDIRGRLLQERSGVNANHATINAGLANEVLLVQITSEDGVVVTKKVIR